MVNLGIYGSRQWFALTGQTILGTADALHPLGTADEDDTITINAIPTFTESPTWTLGDGEAVTITTTDASGGAVAPFVYTSNMPIAGSTGGRALFTTLPTAQLGGWANAIKGYLDFAVTAQAGGLAGLGSAICAELRMPNGAVTGHLFPLEIEWVGQTNTAFSTVGSGAASGFMILNAGGTVTDFDADGVFMSVNGLTAGSGSLLAEDAHTLRCDVGYGTLKYLLLSDAADSISFSYAVSIAEVIAITVATTKVVTTGMSMSGAGTYTNAIVLDADAITTSGIAITTSTPVQGILISAACSTAGINISGAEAIGMSINTATPTSGILISSVCETAGINLSGGSVVGIIIADASTAGMTVAVDTTSANNSKKGLTIAKNITDNVSAGAGLSATNGALEISSTNAKSASGDQILTIGNNLVSITETNSNALAVADVYSGVVLALVYSATTTGNGTSTSTAKALSIDYNLTRTAGTLTVDDTNVVDIDVDFTGDVTVAASGDFHALNINIEDGTTVGWGTTSTCKGINLDMSGLLVADSDLTLTGIKVAMPSAYGTAAAEYAIYASGDGVNVAVCSDAAIGIAMTGVVVTGISLGGTLTTGVSIGACATGLVFSSTASTTGIDFGTTIVTELMRGTCTTSGANQFRLLDFMWTTTDTAGVDADPILGGNSWDVSTFLSIGDLDNGGTPCSINGIGSHTAIALNMQIDVANITTNCVQAGVYCVMQHSAAQNEATNAVTPFTAYIKNADDDEVINENYCYRAAIYTGATSETQRQCLFQGTIMDADSTRTLAEAIFGMNIQISVTDRHTGDCAAILLQSEKTTYAVVDSCIDVSDDNFTYFARFSADGTCAGVPAHSTDVGATASIDADEITGYIKVKVDAVDRYIYLFDNKPSAKYT